MNENDNVVGVNSLLKVRFVYFTLGWWWVHADADENIMLQKKETEKRK